MRRHCRVDGARLRDRAPGRRDWLRRRSVWRQGRPERSALVLAQYHVAGRRSAGPCLHPRASRRPARGEIGPFAGIGPDGRPRRRAARLCRDGWTHGDQGDGETMNVTTSAKFLALVATLSLALGACTRIGTESAGGAGGNPWTHHGVLRMANLSDPDTLNPVIGNEQIDSDLAMLWAGYFFNWND